MDGLNISADSIDLSEWQNVVDRSQNTTDNVVIAFVGKYMDIADSYKSLAEAIIHAGMQTRTKIEIMYVDAENVETEGVGYFVQRMQLSFQVGLGKEEPLAR